MFPLLLSCFDAPCAQIIWSLSYLVQPLTPWKNPCDGLQPSSSSFPRYRFICHPLPHHLPAQPLSQQELCLPGCCGWRILMQPPHSFSTLISPPLFLSDVLTPLSSSDLFHPFLRLLYVDFVYWHLVLVTPNGHTFVCVVLLDLSACRCSKVCVCISPR
jgi:hypothetical protein